MKAPTVGTLNDHTEFHSQTHCVPSLQVKLPCSHLPTHDDLFVFLCLLFLYFIIIKYNFIIKNVYYSYILFLLLMTAQSLPLPQLCLLDAPLTFPGYKKKREAFLKLILRYTKIKSILPIICHSFLPI